MSEKTTAREYPLSKGDTFTFRLEPAMKAALARSAADECIRPAELVRGLLGEHIARKVRRRFEEEARRQCLEINAAAQVAGSDESQVAGELGDDLDGFADEWR